MISKEGCDVQPHPGYLTPVLTPGSPDSGASRARSGRPHPRSRAGVSSMQNHGIDTLPVSSTLKL
jgi:hypothetical protein